MDTETFKVLRYGLHLLVAMLALFGALCLVHSLLDFFTKLWRKPKVGDEVTVWIEEDERVDYFYEGTIIALHKDWCTLEDTLEIRYEEGKKTHVSIVGLTEFPIKDIRYP